MTFSSATRLPLILFGVLETFTLVACSGQTSTNVPAVSLADRTSQAQPSITEQAPATTSVPIATASRAAGSPLIPMQAAQSILANAAKESFKFMTSPAVRNQGVPSLVVGPDSNFYYPGPEIGYTLPVVVQFQPDTGQSTLFSPSQSIADKIDYLFAGAGNGPDGQIWLGSYSCYLVSMTTSGSFLTHEITYPSASCEGAETAMGTTIGDQVWFTAQVSTNHDKNLYYVGYFNATEKKSKVFKVGPISGSYCGDQISNIVQGSDGNLWFGDGPYVGRVTQAGSVHLFTSPLASVCQLTNGPDGNIWYLGANPGIEAFGIMSTQGSDIATVTTTGILYELTDGPDGNIWATGAVSVNAGIYKISVSTHTYTFYQFPNAEAQTILPKDIVTGPDNKLWFDTLQSGNTTKPDTQGLGIAISGG